MDGTRTDSKRLCEIYYSSHIKEREIGVGFVMVEGLTFTPVDEHIATIHIDAKLFHILLICAHRSMEQK